MMETVWPVGVKPPWDNYTPRGLHGPDFSHHRPWMETHDIRQEHMNRLVGMGVSNMTIRTSSDSILEKFDGITVLERLLRNQILPIIRINCKMDRPVHDWLEKLVVEARKIAQRYGIEYLAYILGNEPNDDREWEGQVPNNWKEIAFEHIIELMFRVWNKGGAPGLPDPLGEYGWWMQRIEQQGLAQYFLNHQWWYAAHLYCKDRPLSYPMDDVSKNGTQLTEEEHRDALGDFYSLWKNDPPLELINEQREAWKNPDAHWRMDHTCHGAWRNIQQAAYDYLGGFISVANTEGGPTPKSPAGDGLSSPIDNRYPPYTPEKVAEVVMEIERNQKYHGLWTNCHWLYWSQAWAADSWLTGAYRGVDEEKYWLEMPAVYAYMENEFAGGTPTQESALHYATEAYEAALVAQALLR